MPSTSKSQQRLFGMALACKRGEMKDCSAKVQRLADDMTEEELEKYASTSHEGLPDKVKEDLEDIYSMYADINESKISNEIKQPAGKPLAQAKPQPVKLMGTNSKAIIVDNKKDEPDVIAPIIPGVHKATDKPAITPSLFKFPGEKGKHDRRIYDFAQFMKIINYKTHDGITQKGHGQNLTD